MPSRSMKTTPAVACLKLLLTIFTVILWLIGAALLAGGIYSKIKLGSYNHLTTNMNYASAPYVLIGIGIFIMLIGFFGCYSIAKGNTCMLRTFGFTVGIIFVAEVALAIAVIVYKSKILESFSHGMHKAITNYDKDAKYKEAVDNAQTTLKCCGSNNYTDYWILKVKDENYVPESCCKNQSLCDGVQKDGWLDLPDNYTAYIYTEGCPMKVSEVVNSNLAVILGALFGAAGFQLLGLILSCCLASTINANKYELV